MRLLFLSLSFRIVKMEMLIILFLFLLLIVLLNNLKWFLVFFFLTLLYNPLDIAFLNQRILVDLLLLWSILNNRLRNFFFFLKFLILRFFLIRNSNYLSLITFTRICLIFL